MFLKKLALKIFFYNFMGNKKLIILLKFAIYYKINVKHLLCRIEDQIF